MKSSPLSATLVVMAAAGFFMSAEAAEKSYVERLREITALAKQQRTEADLDMFQYALWTYKLVSGRFPTQEQGLVALVESPTLAPVPTRWQQLTKSLPPDAWKRRSRVASCFAEVTQQIHSFRASAVMSRHGLWALAFDSMAFRKSAGSG